MTGGRVGLIRVGTVQTKNSGMVGTGDQAQPVEHPVYRQILNPKRLSRYPETAKQYKARCTHGTPD